MPFLNERWRIITIKNIIGTSVLLLFSLCALMFMSAKKRNVLHHQLNIGMKNLSNAHIKVFFISDIHRRKIDDKLLRKVGSDFDMVIIGGDLAEKGVPFVRIAENIQKLARLGPIFYVWGNNDREAGEEEIREIIARSGGVILDNENFPVPGHPTWGICGTDDPSSGKCNINATLRNIDHYENVILVSHQPSVLRKVEQFFRPTVMLAGHTHGGQIRIGKLGLFEKGMFQTNLGRGKLISNGYGTSTVPFRLGAAPECHVITIGYTGK